MIIPQSKMPSETMTKFMERNSPLLISALISLFLLIFCNKPFHIDDVYFLEIAENILKNPLDPYSGTITLTDYDYSVFKSNGRPPNTFDTMSHPPLISYVQALIAHFFGFQEIALHIGFMIFPVLCVFSIYQLANRFTNAPVFSSLLFLSSPLFLVNSTNLMTDVPMLGLGLSALSCFIFGIDEAKHRWLVLSGLLTGLAIVTRYVAVGLIPIYVVYVILKRAKLAVLLPTILSMLIILGVWIIENIVHHGGIHLVSGLRHYSKFYDHFSFTLEQMIQKLISSMSAIGGTGFFVFLLLFLFRPFTTRKMFVLLFSLILSIALLGFRKAEPVFSKEYSSFQFFLLFLFVFAGFFLCFSALSQLSPGSDRMDHSFLKTWFCGAMVLSILILPFGTGRYMLPALVPLLFLISFEIRSTNDQRLPGYLLIGVTFGLAVLLTIADYQQASCYKLFANQLKTDFPESRIWFVGDWGFRYYMKRNGYQYLLSTDETPRKDDLIVKAQIAGLHDFSPSLHQRSSLWKMASMKSVFPIRLMSPREKAGFYAHPFGMLPYNFSLSPVEEFTIYRVATSPDGQLP